MTFCDIHTHTPSLHSEDITVINRIVDENDTPLNAPLQSIGIHPWYIYNVKKQMEALGEAASHTNVVAIGEVGFDKLARSPLQLQKEVFLLQARLAEEIHKPLIVHCVKAWEELLAVKKEVGPQMTWIIHGFRGNGILAKQLISQGLYLSFGANYNPEALVAAWPHSLFTETDEAPVDIRQIYQQIAASLQVEDEVFAAQVKENVRDYLLG
ncbi:TatD family hydrolase [Bacteroidia bacterium]|nr:TatD family hydrolase [Bacteroidia bacterium]GHV04735.1 TatD family hydrolase [Bacteroidia bacterium]